MKTLLTLGVLGSAIGIPASIVAAFLGCENPIVRPDLAFLVFVGAMMIQLFAADYARRARPLRFIARSSPEEPDAGLRRWRIQLTTRAARLRRRNLF